MDLPFSDKETEALLVEETRPVPLPEGGFRDVKLFNVTWLNYDIVLEHVPVSATDITARAQLYAKWNRRSFETEFRSVVKRLRRQADRIIARKLAAWDCRDALSRAVRLEFTEAARGYRGHGERRRSGTDGTTRAPLLDFRSLLGKHKRAKLPE